MSYGLGIDLGTTFTAAAITRDGRHEMATLGNKSSAIPSVVMVRDGGTLIGDAADRRAASEPSRVAREVKRRLGDPTPVILGGEPYSAAQILARLLAAVVASVVEREGGPPDGMVLTHPANWGPYKRELFESVPRLAGLHDLGDVTMITEPEAAAVQYASNSRVAEGSLVAVYDLGGGTFDATVLRKLDGSFEFLGPPEGIEGLGGIDFDEAVFAHVDRSVDGALSELDLDDPQHAAALVRVRRECVLAKEALSADTETSISVLLPDRHADVRLTRAELEEMIRPSIESTVSALRRALTSARVEADDLSTVLLVGGSSRIPLVSQMLSAELGRPTMVDTHPKHTVALGAAQVVNGRRRTAAARTAPVGALAGTSMAEAGATTVDSGPEHRGTTSTDAPPHPRVVAAGSAPPALGSSGGDTGAIERARRRRMRLAAVVGATAVVLGLGGVATAGTFADSPASTPVRVAPSHPVAPSSTSAPRAATGSGSATDRGPDLASPPPAAGGAAGGSSGSGDSGGHGWTPPPSSSRPPSGSTQHPPSSGGIPLGDGIGDGPGKHGQAAGTTGQTGGAAGGH